MCEIVEGKIIGCSRYARRRVAATELVKQGICVRCRKLPVVQGKQMCVECRDAHNIAHNIRYAAVQRQQRLDVITAGLCGRCHTEQRRSGRTTCDKCAGTVAQRQRELYPKAYNKLWADPYRLWLKYQRDAKARGFEFSLTSEEFECLVIQPCVYCGGYDKDRPLSGLDRIDRFVGYHTNNVMPCCGTHNKMRNKMTIDEFLDHVLVIKL